MPTALQSQATATHCGRGHALAEHGRFDKGSGRWICRECERVRLRMRKHVAASFTMPEHLLIELDICAAETGVSRNVLLALAVRAYLDREFD